MRSLKENEMRSPSHSTSHFNCEFLSPMNSSLGRRTIAMGEMKPRMARMAVVVVPMWVRQEVVRLEVGSMVSGLVGVMRSDIPVTVVLSAQSSW